VSTFKTFLIEGGKAVQGVGRLNQLNAAETITALYQRVLKPLGLSPDQYAILGSAGKKDPAKNGTIEGSSGDLDCAVQVTGEPREFVGALKELLTRLGFEFTDMPGLGIISFKFPITSSDGLQDGMSVQVDIIPVQDLEYVKWSYFSPQFDASPYKGLYRNEVFFVLARYARQEVTKHVEGEPVEWNRIFFDLNKGLMQGSQSRIGKRGVPVKQAKTVTKSLVSADPDTIVQYLLGPTFKASDAMTFEDVLRCMNSEKFLFKSEKSLIFKDIAKGLEKKGVSIPSELL
jgi:hypothetical protein